MRDDYDLLNLDDLSYVRKDQAETSVLFELISARYERRSLLITANQPFGNWDEILLDKAMAVAAVYRLVHHAVILEMNADSYRRKAAITRMEDQASATTTTAQREDKKPDRHARDSLNLASALNSLHLRSASEATAKPATPIVADRRRNCRFIPRAHQAGIDDWSNANPELAAQIVHAVQTLRVQNRQAEATCW